MIYIGIDNGVSGSIGVIDGDKYYYFKTPTFSQQDYVKEKRNLTRVDVSKLYELLSKFSTGEAVKVRVERPMINSLRFKASISAARALESTLITLDLLEFSYDFIDSKSWQKELLPAGVKGSEELKPASFHIGNRLFPEVSEMISKQKDADGLLIAEWLKRFENGTLTKKFKNP